jgi:four helix bundle protein
MEPKKKIQRLEYLIVWQKSMSLAEEIYRVTKLGEFSKDWGLKNQIQRAAVSIPSNIAEGFERYSAQELRHYLNIAKGSAGELRTQIVLARNLMYLGPLEAEVLLKSCMEISRMLGAYKKRVGRKR